MTASQNLMDRVTALSPEEQQSVARFIDYLEHRDMPPAVSPFMRAADEFIAQHPDLLQRLAQ